MNTETRKLTRASLALTLGLLATAATGCNEGGEARETAGGGLEISQPRPTETPTNPQPEAPAPDPGSDPSATQTCVSTDPERQCIALKVVSYQDSAGSPSLSEAAAAQLVAGVNQVWETCNIAFQIESYAAVNPADYGLSYGAASESETYSIRGEFSDDKTFLMAVTGPWSGSTIAWTQMPGSGPFGVVVDRDYGESAYTVGHELGHYMGLDHLSNTTNLMNPYILSTTNQLSSSQCASARATNLANWTAMLRK